MNSCRVAMLVCVAVLVLAGVRAGSAKPAPDDTNPFAAADAQILSEIHDHSQAMDNLERSEEHTSELQSQSNLVCRLLLEKKNRSRLRSRRQGGHPKHL